MLRKDLNFKKILPTSESDSRVDLDLALESKLAAEAAAVAGRSCVDASFDNWALSSTLKRVMEDLNNKKNPLQWLKTLILLNYKLNKLVIKEDETN